MENKLNFKAFDSNKMHLSVDLLCQSFAFRIFLHKSFDSSDIISKSCFLSLYISIIGNSSRSDGEWSVLNDIREPRHFDINLSNIHLLAMFTQGTFERMRCFHGFATLSASYCDVALLPYCIGLSEFLK